MGSRTLSGLIIILTICPAAHAFKMPWDKLGLEVSAVKVDCAKNADALAKADIRIGDNARSLADVSARIGNVEARVNAQAAAIAGVGNEVKAVTTTVGRDQTTTTTNDSALIQFIFGKWYLFLGAFMAFFGTLVAQYERLLAAKDKQINRLMDESEKDDVEQQKFIQSQTDRIKELTDALQKREVK